MSARLGASYGGLAQVGIEFTQPVPELWTIAARRSSTKFNGNLTIPPRPHKLFHHE